MECKREYKKTNIFIFANRKVDQDGNFYHGHDAIIIVDTLICAPLCKIEL